MRRYRCQNRCRQTHRFGPPPHLKRRHFFPLHGDAIFDFDVDTMLRVLRGNNCSVTLSANEPDCTMAVGQLAHSDRVLMHREALIVFSTVSVGNGVDIVYK